MFRAVPLSIIRSSSTVHLPLVYHIWFEVSLRAWPADPARKLSSILFLVANGHNCIKCTNADVRLRTPDDGQKGCPKHVE